MERRLDHLPDVIRGIFPERKLILRPLLRIVAITTSCPLKQLVKKFLEGLEIDLSVAASGDGHRDEEFGDECLLEAVEHTKVSKHLVEFW